MCLADREEWDSGQRPWRALSCPAPKPPDTCWAVVGDVWVANSSVLFLCSNSTSKVRGKEKACTWCCVASSEGRDLAVSSKLHRFRERSRRAFSGVHEVRWDSVAARRQPEWSPANSIDFARGEDAPPQVRSRASGTVVRQPVPRPKLGPRSRHWQERRRSPHVAARA